MFSPISYTYVDIVKRVAMGLSIEDGEELARGLYSIRPHERFTTHLLGSAWLCYYVMLAWFWAPMYRDIVLEQAPEQARIYDYELALQAGVRALNVWKVCQRNLGIVVAFPRRRQLPVDGDAEAAEAWHWTEVAAAAFVIGVLGWWLSPHGASGVSFAAFTPFYLIGSGAGSADINAGSTIGAAPNAVSTGGSWTNATNTYVATGGTPFAGTVAGDYVSVYADGATVTTYVAKVATAVSNVSVILDATIKYGTAPTDGASNRSAVAGGSWNTEQVLASGGLATTTVPQSTKINIKQATYTITASRTISMAGATTTPLWFSGYNANPGDLDADTTNALAKPIWAQNSTFLLTCSGAHQLWSSVTGTGSRSGTIWTLTGSAPVVVRCRSTNISSNAAAIAITTTTGCRVAYGYFTTPNTATTTGVASVGSATMWIGCIADTGGLAGFNAPNASSLIYCVGLNNTGSGVLSATSAVRIYGLTCYGATVDGVKWTGTPTIEATVSGCLFSGLNGSTATTNGINNASGTNTNNVFRACNDYYNVTNPEVGFGDSPAFFPQTDSNPVVTSAADMTPVPGSNALAHGFPGIYENETFSSYPNIGAVMQVAASGGAPGIIGDGSSW